VTVAVVDSAAVKAIEFNDQDFRVEWYSGTGAGGQNKNKVMASCRILHLPTGLIQTAQTRSRENSLKLAREAMLQLLNSHQDKETAMSQGLIRSKQIGSGMRGDKRRTYRFQDDTVFDAVTNKRASIKKVLSGNFHLLW
jgi:protein subunit release factor A